MSKPEKQRRTRPRIPRGFRDISGPDVLARDRMIARIREVYERYGFMPLETPALEYVDCLGKFLPEADQPDAGIFALRDDDDEWVALRYDLTAPLSRYVAAHRDLPRPFRRYQVGPVYRVEKPGPDRFREFYQFDFDSVGTGSMLADAECAMIMCDTLEALGIKPGDYIIRVNNRKVLNGVLEIMTAGSDSDSAVSRQVLRTIDKLDKVGIEGVQQLLGPGRKDDSGAFIKGVGLPSAQIGTITAYLDIAADTRALLCDALETMVADSEIGKEGVDELRQIDRALEDAGYAEERVVFDPTVVRGLEYYTGPVFEGVLTFAIVDAKGNSRQFGSVFGGGRYDNLVERFTGQSMPATGASIGVDRLLAALKILGKTEAQSATDGVLVTRIDKELTAHYQKLATDLRSAGINTELYVGKQSIGKQFKYADSCGKTIAVVMGSDEMQAGQVSLKDLRLGRELSKEIGDDRKRWLEEQPAQVSVDRGELVAAVQRILARYSIA